MLDKKITLVGRWEKNWMPNLAWISFVCLFWGFFCEFGNLLEQNLSAKLEINSKWVQLNVANTKHG